MRHLCTFFAAALLTGALATASAPAMAGSLTVVGSEFRLATGGGELTSRDLVGSTFVIVRGGKTARLRIDAVEADPKAVIGPVWLHTLSMQAADGSWQNICDPGPDGRRQGFPIAGRARADGAIEPAGPGAFELTCTGGARGKCVRFGYLPGTDAAHLDLYNTCIRLVRADYAGDGRGTTRNGMLIDIYDDVGIQEAGNNPETEFEAGWAVDGAVCVRHVRVKENVTLAELEELARLHGRTGAVCTEEFARAHGAVIFNRSRP